MYAIVDIAGQQFKVEKDQEIFVHRLSDDEGKGVEFDNVLLLDNDGKVSVGTPKVDTVTPKPVAPVNFKKVLRSMPLSVNFFSLMTTSSQ